MHSSIQEDAVQPGQVLPFITAGEKVYFEVSGIIWMMRLRADYLAAREMDGARTSASLLAYEIADELETAQRAITRQENPCEPS